jgi:hypothetical protein
MDFKLKTAEGNWVPANKINFQGCNFIPDTEIADNNRANLELIDEWIRPAKVHEDHAIIVSAGPSVDCDEIKRVMRKHPNHKLLCVKHVLPKLYENGIKPWGLVVLDTRPVTEISTLGALRIKLFEKLTPDTNCFVLTRTHPTYTFIFQKIGARIIGFHNHLDEIATALKMTQEELDRDHPELAKELKLSLTTLPGSCAGICAINIAIFMGFRNLHLFGFDASVKDPKDSLDKCHLVESNNKSYWVPNEFVSYGLEFQTIFKRYPIDLNCNIKHYGESFIHALYETIKPYELDTFDEVMKNTNTKSDRLDKMIEKVNGGYFNKTIRNNDMIVRGYRTYEDYVAIQTRGNIEKNNWIFVNKDCITKLVDYIMKHYHTKMGPKYAPTFGLCHGTRRGLEQKWFKEALFNYNEKGCGCDCKVLGTEISETAKNFENTIQLDFHRILDEWINNVDFIYSNSFDHSYDPELCLDQWMKCVKRNCGLCILEWTKTHAKEVTSHLDPFGASKEGYKKLIEKKYKLLDVLEMGVHPMNDGRNEFGFHDRTFFIIAHK